MPRQLLIWKGRMVPAATCSSSVWHPNSRIFFSLYQITPPSFFQDKVKTIQEDYTLRRRFSGTRQDRTSWLEILVLPMQVNPGQLASPVPTLSRTTLSPRRPSALPPRTVCISFPPHQFTDAVPRPPPHSGSRVL